MNIQVVWGTTPKNKNLHDAGLYPHLNTQDKFTADFWLTQDQIQALKNLVEEVETPALITGFQIIRGAFHGHYTRIRPLTENWGRDHSDTYDKFLYILAKTIGWYHVKIDGANAVVKQDPSQKTTWERWKKNNPSSHLRESSKKNWEIYHKYIEDFDQVGEWDDLLFNPSDWETKFKNQNQ